MSSDEPSTRARGDAGAAEAHVGGPGGSPSEGRALALRLDAAGLAAWLAVHDRATVGASSEAAPEQAPELQALRLWAGLLAGTPAPADEARRIAAAAASRKDAALVVEANTLAALLLFERGAVDEAVATARRACRMAQSEAAPDLEVLSHLVLARLRRQTGRPHLAAHVLRALAPAASPALRPWIAWELALAGGEPEIAFGGPADDRATRAVAALLAAADAGATRALAEARAALQAAAPPWPSMQQEAACLIAALTPDETIGAERAPAALQEWRDGTAVEIPHGLYGVARGPARSAAASAPGGVAASEGAGDAEVLAYVSARPGQRGRRVLARALPLLLPTRPLPDAEADLDLGTVRTDIGLAALALSGPPGLPLLEFFRDVYGFAYVAARHQAVLRTLLHRMRKRLGDLGAIERRGGDPGDEGEGHGEGRGIDRKARADRAGERVESGALVLTLTAPTLIPDYRCVLPVGDRILRVLGSLGSSGAERLARSLSIPLRTVQRSLQQLILDGSCRAERRHGRVEYHLLDTTVSSVDTLGRRG